MTYDPPVPVVPSPPYTLGSVMPPPKRRRLPLLIAGGALLAAALVGVGLYLFLPGSIVVHGDLRLYADSDALKDGSGGCTGHGGFSDIHPGTQVTVTGPDGTVLGFGTLSAGELLNSNTCRFTFTVTVPAGQDSYAFSTGNRGELRFTEDDVIARGVHLTLGG